MKFDYHMKSKLNKKQSISHPLSSTRTHLLPKKLSNIQQDLQIQSQIRMPNVQSKKKSLPTPQMQLGDKLKRIIKISCKRKSNNHSVQSHSSFNNNQTIYSKNGNGFIRSQNLPQIKPIPENKRNKSSLDKIFSDRSVFVKAYFDELSRAEKMRKNHPEEDEQGVQFQFPQIKVGNWKVRGYLKQSHILLKGTNKDGHICIKKYDYKKIYQKIRKDYQTWVQSKFCFQA